MTNEINAGDTVSFDDGGEHVSGCVDCFIDEDTALVSVGNNGVFTIQYKKDLKKL